MKYDHIIVGAGSAGAALAARLTEDPDRSVLLLEAGGDYPELERIPDEVRLAYGSEIPVWDSDHIWNFSARATDLTNIDVPRGKITGGSSGVNGAQFCAACGRTTTAGPSGATTSGPSKACCPTL